jgi:hypothetical protein
MNERLATLSVAVALDASGNVTQLTHATNAPDLAFWRPVLDALWQEQVRERARQAAMQEQAAPEEASD